MKYTNTSALTYGLGCPTHYHHTYPTCRRMHFFCIMAIDPSSVLPRRELNME